MSAQAVEADRPVLELSEVTAGYGRTVVLRGISLAVQPGTVVGLLGPNGAGKTTLLRVASGLIRPKAGSVRLRGQEVSRRAASARARAGLCLIPEGRGIFPSLTVRDNILVSVPARAGRRDAIEQVVSAFPALKSRLGQVAGSMSGGQQQMLALARCYVASPEVILLDEVSIGLAPLVVDEIYETIGRLASGGTALLLVEQYVDRVLAIADMVHVLSRGNIEFSGPPSTISRAELMERYLNVKPEAQAPQATGDSAPAPALTSQAPRPHRNSS